MVKLEDLAEKCMINVRIIVGFVSMFQLIRHNKFSELFFNRKLEDLTESC